MQSGVIALRRESVWAEIALEAARDNFQPGEMMNGIFIIYHYIYVSKHQASVEPL